MRCFFFTLGFISIVLGACSDNSSVNAPASQDFDTTIVSNGFHVTGDGYQYAPFALPSYAGAYTTGNGWSTVIHSDFVRRPGRQPVNVLVVLRFPDARGTSAWTDLIEQPAETGSAFARIDIDGKEYVSTAGNTTVVFFRDVMSNSVTGTFAGTLQSAFGETIVIDDGRFKATFDQP